MYKQVLQGQEPHKVQLMLALFFLSWQKLILQKITIYKYAIGYLKILPFGLIFISKYLYLEVGDNSG